VGYYLPPLLGYLMSWIVQNLWLIPALPLLAAGLSALCLRRQRRIAASLSIGSMVLSLLLSCCAFATTLKHSGHGEIFRQIYKFDWFVLGETSLKLGWMLDPLTAVMLAMVTFVSLLIFIYSVGYMAHDDNFTRFFCFLSLFAAAMLGLVIANSLLLLFISWELVGLASYLLIGFWYHKPSAAAAARKAFIVTRIGDVFFFLGILWLYAETGTLLFYDEGGGCLEQSALVKLVGPPGLAGAVISLLIFCGAIGKSGQVPLHVWLPDAMEGPTPVSALIHAATMVAAGVFLVARVFPLMCSGAIDLGGEFVLTDSPTLLAVTWIGAITAVFGALIAVAQTDIKRILAYSTVSQLGYMFMGLGVGGVAVGMFHLITHAFFKALLFLGAGSVIHGCHEEQDIRRMGGLRKFMPVTFATYAIGMMALSGVPLLFSGFWSKDEILHSALHWEPSKIPFLMGIVGAFLTAFYMTRQVCCVFFGEYRSSRRKEAHSEIQHPASDIRNEGVRHESPRTMTIPLIILAAFSILLGFIGTPIWPWFQSFLGAHHESVQWSSVLVLMLVSTAVVVAGLGAGWLLYGRKTAEKPAEAEPLERWQPSLFAVLRQKFYVDELYAATVVRLNAGFARFCDWLDRTVLDSLVQFAAYLMLGLSWLNRVIDEYVIDLGFDQACERLRRGGGLLSNLQNGQVQTYLRVIALALTLFLLLLTWGCSK
jgi:NADH-quinone oxidoreductase subunit L